MLIYFKKFGKEAAGGIKSYLTPGKLYDAVVVDPGPYVRTIIYADDGSRLLVPNPDDERECPLIDGHWLVADEKPAVPYGYVYCEYVKPSTCSGGRSFTAGKRYPVISATYGYRGYTTCHIKSDDGQMTAVSTAPKVSVVTHSEWYRDYSPADDEPVDPAHTTLAEVYDPMTCQPVLSINSDADCAVVQMDELDRISSCEPIDLEGTYVPSEEYAKLRAAFMQLSSENADLRAEHVAMSSSIDNANLALEGIEGETLADRVHNALQSKTKLGFTPVRIPLLRKRGGWFTHPVCQIPANRGMTLPQLSAKYGMNFYHTEYGGLDYAENGTVFGWDPYAGQYTDDGRFVISMHETEDGRAVAWWLVPVGPNSSAGKMAVSQFRNMCEASMRAARNAMSRDAD